MTRTLAGLTSSALVFGLLGLGLASSARAADDGYANVFSSLGSAVGLLKPDPQAEIEYRERAPLVIPPQPGLPKPRESAARSGAWPQDPDKLARQREIDAAREPGRAKTRPDGEVTSAAELAKGRVADEPVRPNECGINGNNRACLIVSPEELKRQSDEFAASNPDSKDTLVAGEEPQRVYLTQPPKGYMKPTKAMKATAEAPIPKIDESSPYRMFDRQKPADE